MTNTLLNIPSKLEKVRSNIEKAKGNKEVKLVAVSKFHSEEAVKKALEADQRVFGENRVQEAKEKFANLRLIYPDLELHMIGHLQKNKAKLAINTFHFIDTLDSKELANELAKAIRAAQKENPKFEPPLFCIEVNIGEEPQKDGIAPDVASVKDLFEFSRDVCGLTVIGLMCVPPETPPEGKTSRSYFKELRELADKIGMPHSEGQRMPNGKILSLPRLSMGMSSDYEDAIKEGATDIRVGTDIFGPRPSPQPAKNAGHNCACRPG